MAATGQPGVYLLQENGGLVEMLEQPYDSEALLHSSYLNTPACSREVRLIPTAHGNGS